VKSIYQVKSGSTLIATFDQKGDAYHAKEQLQRDGTPASVNKQVLYECFGEWDGLHA
jgi:hypothetical protein